MYRKKIKYEESPINHLKGFIIHYWSGQHFRISRIYKNLNYPYNDKLSVRKQWNMYSKIIKPVHIDWT